MVKHYIQLCRMKNLYLLVHLAQFIGHYITKQKPINKSIKLLPSRALFNYSDYIVFVHISVYLCILAGAFYNSHTLTDKGCFTAETVQSIIAPENLTVVTLHQAKHQTEIKFPSFLNLKPGASSILHSNNKVCINYQYETTTSQYKSYLQQTISQYKSYL